MAERLFQTLPKDLLDYFQIICSRVKELDNTKIRVLWLHDLPSDPESAHLKNGGWKKFHLLVFVSNWQMQAYINYFAIPYSKCIVIANAIEPIEAHDKPKDIINIAYWSTPHRGLDILIPVFEQLSREFDNIRLNVYSSFNLYGWPENDRPYEQLFETCRNHPKINYRGTVSNETIREELKSQHILAYPSTWVETSCLVLMEAMSAGMLCVHSNLGALYETAANWTSMYQYNEDPEEHSRMFYECLRNAIKYHNHVEMQPKLLSQKAYADVFYNWGVQSQIWEGILRGVYSEPKQIELPAEPAMFIYHT